MLNQHKLRPTPLREWKPRSEMDKAGTAYFETVEEAQVAAQDSPLGKEHGFEIFKQGNGELK